MTISAGRKPKGTRLDITHERLCIGQLHTQACLFVLNAVSEFGLSRAVDDVDRTIKSVCIVLCKIAHARDESRR